MKRTITKVVGLAGLIGSLLVGGTALAKPGGTDSLRVAQDTALGYWADTIGNQDGEVDLLEKDYMEGVISKEIHQDDSVFYVLTEKDFSPLKKGMQKVYFNPADVWTDKDFPLKKREKFGLLELDYQGGMLRAFKGRTKRKDFYQGRQPPEIDYAKIMKNRRKANKKRLGKEKVVTEVREESNYQPNPKNTKIVGDEGAVRGETLSFRLMENNKPVYADETSINKHDREPLWSIVPAYSTAVDCYNDKANCVVFLEDDDRNAYTQEVRINGSGRFNVYSKFAEKPLEITVIR